MRCPIVHITTEAKNGDIIMVMGECIKEGCAWWDPANKCCAVRTIVSVLSRLTKKQGEGI